MFRGSLRFGCFDSLHWGRILSLFVLSLLRLGKLALELVLLGKVVKVTDGEDSRQAEANSKNLEQVEGLTINDR